MSFDLKLFFVSVDPTLPLKKPIHFKYFKMITLLVTFFSSRYPHVPTCSQTFDRTLKRNMYEEWNFNSGNYLFTTDTK